MIELNEIKAIPKTGSENVTEEGQIIEYNLSDFCVRKLHGLTWALERHLRFICFKPLFFLYLIIMKKFIYIFLGIVLFIVIAFFSYDYYMRNSGLKNRLEYEIKKNDMGVDYGNTPLEDWNERRLDKKEERRERRQDRRDERRR